MDTGGKLKEARMAAGLTQEQAAENLKVSRQTMSNWENNRSYPDILNVLAMSDLYHASLDRLLKGDPELMEHIQESMDTVKQTRRLLIAVLINMIVFAAACVILRLTSAKAVLVIVFLIMIASMSFLLTQIIEKI